MKIKSIVTLSLAALMLCAPATIDAQRKAGARKTTTSRSGAKKSGAAAKKSGASKATVSAFEKAFGIKKQTGAAFTTEDYYGSVGECGPTYDFYFNMGDALIRVKYRSCHDNATLDFSFQKSKGTWSVDNNKFMTSADGNSFTMTTPDKGMTFFGNYQSGAKNLEAVGFRCGESYTLGDAKWIDDFKKAMDAGKIKAAYMTLEANNQPTLACPVKLTVSKTDDGYSWKIASDNKLMQAVQTTKGTITINPDSESTSQLTGETFDGNSIFGYTGENWFSIYLGRENIPGVGRVELEIRAYY